MSVKPERRHVLFIVPSLCAGGAERVAVTLLRHLNRRTFRISLAVVDTREAVFLDDVPSDVDLIDLGSTRVRGAIPKIISQIWRLQPDVVFSTLGHLNVALGAVRAVLPRGIRYIARETTIPSRAGEAFRVPAWWLWAYRRFYRCFDRVVCQSEAMQQDLAEHFGIPMSRMVVINNPVDIDRIRAMSELPIDDDVQMDSGAVQLVAAGSMTHVKGFDLLIEALARCERRDLKLTLLGEGPLTQTLQGLAVERGLAGRVRFAGFRKNPYVYFRRADALVISSRFEGFPNVALEALACGTPVIALPSPGGLREIIGSVKGCVIAEQFSVDSLARVLQQFVGARVAPHAVEPYALMNIVSRYEDILRLDGYSGLSRQRP